MEPTQEEIARNAHIPDSEIEQDIFDTEQEIATMRREVVAFAMLGDRMSDILRTARLQGIKEREAFIVKLRALLKAREPQSEGS